MATDSSQLPTVLLSVRAWRESPGREELMLQLSVEPENARDFRLSVRRLEAARGLGSTIAEFKLKDVNYTTRCSRSHELSVPGKPGCPMIFHFESEHDALQWWNVVSSCLREVLKAAQNHGSVLLNKHVASSSPVKGLSIDAVPAMTLADMPTKEDLAVRLGRAIETGDQQLAAQCALVLTKQKVPLQIQLKQNCYPKTEICMKVGVEDASGSANISINVQAHTTIALLKQQMFQDYQFHPSVQRWIIGQCLCLDDRTVGSYGIKKDGDTAFLYLLSAKQAKLNVQDQYLSYQNPSLFTSPSLMGETKFHTLPPRPPPKNVAQKKRRNDEGQIVDLVNVVQNLHLEIDKLSKNSRPPLPAAPPSPAQPGWPCPVCTYINKPTRPGCEMCSTERPLDYVIPVQYTPDEIERRRLQQEQESLQQYNQAREAERLENFMHLLQLDNEVLIPNQEAIECLICYTAVPAGEGVLLRECLHSFCRECLRQVVNCCEDPEVSCPFRDDTYSCYSKLQQREIRALVTQEEYSRFLERGLVVAESRSQNSYHCRTADCKGWCIYEDSVNEFSCPICHAQNCLICKAIHDGMNCKEYQDDLRIRALNDAAARQTNDMLKTLVQTGEAMYCPVCKIIVQKKDGCDWIRCTMCQTEICWVTKGPRWGPLGPGDTTGGCQCNVNGKRCDPRCQNCH